MQRMLWLILALVAGGTGTTGCVPVAIGAGSVVVVDEIMEDKNGGDGLF